MSNLMTNLGQAAQKVSRQLGNLSTPEKNTALLKMAEFLRNNVPRILAANQKDLEKAPEYGIRPTMIDRLKLTAERIEDMAIGIEQVAALTDPIGEVEKMWQTPEGLTIGQKRVALGVIGIIFESRPNVTTDAASLCFKTGNCVILRGGKEAFYSNQTLVDILQETLLACDLPKEAIQFVSDTSHEVANQMMQLTDYLDVLIPRGSDRLIQRVKQTATVPVIETGTGNNHVYVDHAADLEMAVQIVINAKAQRPSVCNAIETILVHTEVADDFLPLLAVELKKNAVEVHADETAIQYFSDGQLATEADWQTEFLDYILAIRVVSSLDEAINHINHYNTKHSEAIVTDSYQASQRFLNEVDAAAVYVNASTRFTDGFMFGFGAEIGISTQKLHARGPMGLLALTSSKYIIYGNGQIRE
ncbi:glutamate-5-semialdehyde dehydrogenase [Enterococcus sp. ALS3]|uniref:Gamma-glutamyl phosphate reductase n=1 Tax=Enterococcus alishanensis TaxID=1303817 RepID=A0ABS6TFD4_9ENTE|nr:glutamate-5-semialdehyde dehydrogenase [Enterococcus alishanensis]MBV7391619.1 glutamate-5-semialdehyde dehydrogenase [Enterococcus alishanensis]